MSRCELRVYVETECELSVSWGVIVSWGVLRVFKYELSMFVVTISGCELIFSWCELSVYWE